MRRETRLTDQSGAIVIHVAIALIALLAFTSFVIDYGIMWVSRRQAQNVADAGALAGAVTLIEQSGTPAIASAASHHFAAINPIWGQANSASNVEVALSGSTTSIPPCGNTPGCVRVDVFRNMPDRAGTLRGSAIPTFFARLVGRNDQGVRATATAETAEGKAITCLLPFALIDRWADNFDENPDPTYYTNDPLSGEAGWSANDKYQSTATPTADQYVPPYDNNPNHTGWTVQGDYGRQLIVKAGDMGDYSVGWAQRVDLPDSTGAQDYNWNILNCSETAIGIATAAEPCAPAPGGDTTGREINGCVSVSTGMAQGPTVQNGINVLTDNDPNLVWDNSVTGPFGLPGAPVDTTTNQIRLNSMRIRPIVVFDIGHYEASVLAGTCNGTNCIGKVANIIGFFIQGTCAQVEAANALAPGNACEPQSKTKDIVGRIVTIPGQFVAGTGDVANDAAFIRIVRLVR